MADLDRAEEVACNLTNSFTISRATRQIAQATIRELAAELREAHRRLQEDCDTPESQPLLDLIDGLKAAYKAAVMARAPDSADVVRGLAARLRRSEERLGAIAKEATLHTQWTMAPYLRGLLAHIVRLAKGEE